MTKFKGLIIIAEPDICKAGRDPFYALVDLLCEEFGFGRMELTKDSKIPSDIDLLINYSNFSDQIVELNRRIKLITWMGDVNISPCPFEQMKQRKRRRKEVYERSDLILLGMRHFFRKKYPQFMDKMIFFPKHYGYYEHFCDVFFNENPKRKCLLSGSTHEDTYPIRSHVRKNIGPGLLDKCITTVPDCRKKRVPLWRHTGKDYAKLLNSYFCCVTDSSIYKCVPGKYYEIPAAGSLLIANRTEDSDLLGFVPGVHYVAVTRGSVIRQIKDCLDYPGKYNQIRKAGMQFVRTCHSPFIRFEKFKRVIRKVMG